MLFSQLSSAASDSAAPWTAARQASLSITSSRPNSLLLSRWCHPTISSSGVPFSSCLQSFPGSGSLRMSQVFTSCGRNSCCNENEMRESLKNLKYPLDSKNQLLIIADSSVVVCVWNTSCELTHTQPIQASNLVLYPARPAFLAFSAPLLLQSFKCPSDFWPFLLFFFLLPISFYSSYLQFYLWLEVHSRISASLSFTVSKSLDGTLSGLQPVSTWESHSTWPCSSLLDHIIKAMVFLVVMYRCQSWALKKVKHQSIDAFELWCWRRLLGVLWTAGRSNQSILKEINPEYSLEGLMLELKLQYFGHVMQRANSLEKTWCWERLRAEEAGNRGWDGWVASPT